MNKVLFLVKHDTFKIHIIASREWGLWMNYEQRFWQSGPEKYTENPYPCKIELYKQKAPPPYTRRECLQISTHS